MNEIKHPPIIVVGLPRSGTSLVTGIMKLCGAWTGEVTPPSQYNVKGDFENIAIQKKIVRPYLEKLGTDPMALTSLPPLDAPFKMQPETLRAQVHGILHSEGYFNHNSPWVIKECKIALCWRLWAEAFPDAKWVVVQRPDTGVLGSCWRAHPMTGVMGHDVDKWVAWLKEYRKHVASIPDPLVIDTNSDVLSNPRIMKGHMESLGLTNWDGDAIKNFIDKGVWHR